MITDQLTGLEALLTRRFLFNALLPTLIFLTGDATVILVFTGDAASVEAWRASADTLSLIIFVGVYLAATWFLSVAVAGQWRNIVRFFEGYPAVSIAARFGRAPLGVRWHQQNMRNVREVRMDVNAAYYRYPRPNAIQDILPTRLGNILLAAEKYPLDRYKIDPIIFWPRLFPLLPQQFQRDYEEFVREYEFPLIVSMLSALSSLALGTTAVLTAQEPLVFIASFLGPMIVAYLAYLVALPAAVEMGEQQRTAFDLYRDRLLDAWPTVADVQDDQEAFGLILDFVLRKATPSWGSPHERALARHREAAKGVANTAPLHEDPPTE